MFKKTISILAVAGLVLALAPAAHAALLAGWDDWADGTGPFDADDVLTGFSAQISGIGSDRINSGFGSTDGTYGTVAGANSAGVNGLLVRETDNNRNMTIDITNSTGSSYDIESFHFDFAPRDDPAKGGGQIGSS